MWTHCSSLSCLRTCHLSDVYTCRETQLHHHIFCYLDGCKEMPYRVRTAVTADIPTIVDFQIAMALETENLNLDVDRVRYGVAVPFERENVAEYLVVEEVPDVAEAERLDAEDLSTGTPRKSLPARGPVRSMLMLTFEWSDWRGGRIDWIQSVYTHPQHRRRGLFKSLFHFVKTRVESDPEAVAIRLYVEHENEDAIRTYKSLGLEMESGYRMMKWAKTAY